jgi:hypothetical protein
MLKRSPLPVILFLFGLSPAHAQLPRLQVSDNGRYLATQEGNPFFYLGDTAWELFHRLNREEADLYLERRAAQGFTVIQAVVLAEFDGLTQPNAYGHVPLVDNDPARPNEAYFEHVDYIVNKAESLGIYIGMLPTWGDKFNKKWGVGPEVFTPENARTYGAYLGERYRAAPIIWVLGGDRIPEQDQHFAIIRAMAEGLRQGDQDTHLMTYHPQGGRSSSEFFHDDAWLDFNMFQSGHGQYNNPNYVTTLRVYHMQPTKPILDGEPNYEDHPVNWQPANGWFDEFDSRRAGYWSMLAGAMGHTYGNHNIWQMLQPGREPISWARTPWRQALTYPGAYQAGYMRTLFESRPWWLLQPDQSLLRSGPNTGGKEVRVALASDGSCVLAYSPYGSTFTLSLTQLTSARLHGWWFNPRDNTYVELGAIDVQPEIVFDPPSDEKRGNDWLLVLDDADKRYPPPGSAPIVQTSTPSRSQP